MDSAGGSRPVVVMKFGGTSVEDAAAIRRLMEVVKGRRDRQLRPVVVVSALARVTDDLIAAAQMAVTGQVSLALARTAALRERHHGVASELAGRKLSTLLVEIDSLFAQLDIVLGGIGAVGELTARTLDLVSSFGERLSSLIVAQAFEHRGISSSLVDARSCILTDDRYGKARPQADQIARAVQAHLVPLLNVQAVPVVGGFFGASLAGVTTTLGRGGSDYTAALLGRALNASAIEIWTDVNGIMTTDPRICPEAQRLQSISFEQASELAYFGAKVLHPATILPAVEAGIPVWVLNSREPANEGTVVTSTSAETKGLLTSIALKKHLTVVHIKSRRLLVSHGFLRKVFDVLDRLELPVNMLASSEVSLSVALDSADQTTQISEGLSAFADVTLEHERALVCLVGDLQPGSQVATRALHCVSGLELEMISLGANRISMSLLVRQTDVDRIVKRLHAEFFGMDPKPLPQEEPRHVKPVQEPSLQRSTNFASDRQMAWHMVVPYQGMRTA